MEEGAVLCLAFSLAWQHPQSPMAQDSVCLLQPQGTVIQQCLGSHPSCCVREALSLPRIHPERCWFVRTNASIAVPALGSDPWLWGRPCWIPQLPGVPPPQTWLQRSPLAGSCSLPCLGSGSSPSSTSSFFLGGTQQVSVFPAHRLPFPGQLLSSSAPVISDTLPGASSPFEIPQEREIHIC